jgi:hypothetical protein
MDMTASINATVLREIARCCLVGEPLRAELARVLGAALQGFLSRRHPTIEAALGIITMRGGISWLAAEANRLRDSALRELAERACPGQSVAAQARFVHVMSIRYAATAWPRERDLPIMPERYSGTAHEPLWQAFKSGGKMPVGERQLRNILRR